MGVTNLREQPVLGNATGTERAASRLERSRVEWLPGVIVGSARIIDGVVLVAAAIAAFWIYVHGVLMAGEDQSAAEPFWRFYYLLIFCALILQLHVFQLAGIYRFATLTDIGYQISRSILATAILFLVLVAVLYLAKVSATYSRGWMLLWFALSAGGLAAARLLLCPAMRRWIREGHVARRVAIVGSGGPAERLAGYLANFQDAPIDCLGIFDDRAGPRDGPAYRTIDQLCELARTQAVDEIILATPQISEERLAAILHKMRSLPVDVRLCRDTLDHFVPQSSYEFCGIVPLLRLYDKPVSGWGMLAKSAEDKLLACLLLLLIGPIFLLITALIKLDSPGPVFFKQKRYGFNNRVITVWKFRTMHHDQEDLLGARQIMKDDPRVTRVGALLRRWSLDELPQLINVLLGDMSMVGPRPHPLMSGVAGRLFEEVVEEYAARHRVKPGITGWAQVHGWHGAADTDEKIRERVKHDLYYIDNWSILLDLKILVMTAFVVLKRQDA